MTKIRRDLHQEITDRIIAALEAGTRPWDSGRQAAGLGGFPLRSCGKHYKGINVLLLWLAADENSFTSPYWFTFKQAQALGAHVRKGEKGTGIVFYKTLEKEGETIDPRTGELEVARIPMLKTYTVFNAAQIEGLPARFYNKPADLGTRPIAELEAFFAATGARILHDNPSAPHYHRRTDDIHMPTIESYVNAPAYYGTLAHELIHWTGAGHRLNRFEKFATRSDYAFEELIAELGNVFLCTELACPVSIENSAAYVGSWLAALRNDKRFVFQAAAAAQKACDYTLELGGHALSDLKAGPTSAEVALETWENEGGAIASALPKPAATKRTGRPAVQSEPAQFAFDFAA